MKRRQEAGFAMLMELMIVCIVTAVLMAAAVPSFIGMLAAQNQSRAKQRMADIAQAVAAVNFCALQTPTCSASSVSPMIPSAGQQTIGGYVFTMTGTTAAFTLTAVPVSSATGKLSLFVDNSGIMRCSTTSTVNASSAACSN